MKSKSAICAAVCTSLLIMTALITVGKISGVIEIMSAVAAVGIIGFVTYILLKRK